MAYVDVEDSNTPRQFNKPQHFIIVGCDRECLTKWVVSLSGHILHQECNQILETVVDKLMLHEDGTSIVTFEKKKIIIRDEYLRVCNIFCHNNQSPVDGKFVGAVDDLLNFKPCFYICCFEDGAVMVSGLLNFLRVNCLILYCCSGLGYTNA